MKIRSMHGSDLDFAARCTAAEGWAGETREVFEGFLSYDPRGCFIAEEKNKRIGLCIATSYGESGFIGELIVIQEERGRGVGSRLLNHSIRYLRRRGAKNIFLDGDLAAVPLYEKNGFRKICRSLRFKGKIQGREHQGLRPISNYDLDAICSIDRKAFGADRRFFIERQVLLYPTLCKVLEYDGEIAGFILGQPGMNSISVGPWIVQSNVKQPSALLESLAAETDQLDLRIGVLESNTKAVEAMKSFTSLKHQEPSWRMVLGPSGSLGQSFESYAIGSAATG